MKHPDAVPPTIEDSGLSRMDLVRALVNLTDAHRRQDKAKLAAVVAPTPVVGPALASQTPSKTSMAATTSSPSL